MRILIIGGGKVGLFIARELSEQHEIVVVEKNVKNANKIKDNYDVLTVIGDGDDPSILREAEIEKAEVMLAVSGDDRTNILASIIGHSFGIKKIITRIRSPHYLEYPKILNESEIEVINPGTIISDKIYSLIAAPFAWRTESFAEGKIELFKLRVEEDTPIVNKKLSELGPAESWIFVGVSRDRKIFIPTGDTVLQPGDYVFALGVPHVLKKLKELFNLKLEKIHSAIIVGAGRLGRIVGSKLHDKGISVKIIEADSELSLIHI